MTTTYVSSDYIQQVARIRQHLTQYKNAFLSLTYVNGVGAISESAYDIWVNLCLITSKIRPAFMIQWVDYLESDTYYKIMNLLVNYRDALDPVDIDYRLLFLTDPQGIIVTTYYSFYKTGLRSLYQQYIDSDRDVTLLGKILGYPAAGEHKLLPGEQEYFKLNQQPPGRHTYSIRTGKNQTILANIYRTPETRARLNDLFITIRDIMKLYDPNAIILVEDSQTPIDPRITAKDIYIPYKILMIDLSETRTSQYELFINAPERLVENWNNEFDRIFEIGYIYNR